MKERKLLTYLIGILTILLIVEGGFNLFLAPRLRITNVVLDSDLNLDDGALLHITGLDRDNWFFSLDQDVIQASLMNLAAVEEAFVVKHFPNKLTITIVSREPLIMAVSAGPREVLPLIIDKEGVIFLSGREVFSYDLPLLGGFDTSLSVAGKRIPQELNPLLGDLELLRVGSKELFDIISEINVISLERGVLDVEMILTTHSIPVILDLPLTREKMSQAIMLVDVMEKEGLASRIEGIDLRSGSIVYREKEAEGV